MPLQLGNHSILFGNECFKATEKQGCHYAQKKEKATVVLTLHDSITGAHDSMRPAVLLLHVTILFGRRRVTVFHIFIFSLLVI